MLVRVLITESAGVCVLTFGCSITKLNHLEVLDLKSNCITELEEVTRVQHCLTTLTGTATLTSTLTPPPTHTHSRTLTRNPVVCQSLC